MKRFSVLIAALALACTAATASAATVLTTPSGLNPGDKFRFLFLTSGSTTATSGNIDDYNTFVQNDAAGATYEGNVVNWKAIGSTTAIAARDNVGGFGTLVPVYRPDGTKLANDLTTNVGGLWGVGFPPNNLPAAPNQLLDGTIVANDPPFTPYPWTGSEANGLAWSSYELGGALVVAATAQAVSSFPNWIKDYYALKSQNRAMYGLSEELTVGGGGPTPIPEIDPAGLGSVLALVTGVLALVERRRLGTAAA